MPDSAQQTFIKVGPNGEITYDFEGHISAQGLDLLAGLTGAPPDDRKVRWLRESDGAMVAQLLAFHERTPGVGNVTQAAWGMRDPDAPATRYANLLLQTEDIAGSTTAQLGVGYGGQQQVVTLLDHAGASGFARVRSTVRTRQAWGSALVPFAASVNGSLTVNHGLNNTSATVLLTLLNATGIDVNNGHVHYYVQNQTANSFEIVARLTNGAPATGDVAFTWLALSPSTV